jgi:hypothetical protein
MFYYKGYIMNKNILMGILIYCFTVLSYANTNRNQAMSEHQITKMDHRLSKHKATKRHFSSQKEFRQTQSRGYSQHQNYTPNSYQDHYPSHQRQRGYRESKRGWILAYKYDRASFYDSYGYFYGYFNRHGYYFEDVFYRYDRRYRYSDRIKGKSLFQHRYYMPDNARYYGFSR